MLTPDNAYGPNKTLAEDECAAFGISYPCYDLMNATELAASRVCRA